MQNKSSSYLKNLMKWHGILSLLLVVRFEHHTCYIRHHTKAYLFNCCSFWISLSLFILYFECTHLSLHVLFEWLSMNSCFPLKTIVEAIMEIKELYRVAKHGQGDPCVPSEFTWDGLNCSKNNPPRIVSL